MRFILDESLFDDDMSFTFDEPTTTVFNEGDFDSYKDDLDDSLFTYEPIARANVLTDHDGEAIPEGPKAGLESGIADALINLINDEWEAIQGYNDFRAMILQMHENGDGDYLNSLNVIDEIVNEENLHVGQLQTLLKQISPNAASINKGEQEGSEQLEKSSENVWMNGKLKVEAHTPIVYESADKSNPNEISTDCTLDNIDDEW